MTCGGLVFSLFYFFCGPFCFFLKVRDGGLLYTLSQRTVGRSVGDRKGKLPQVSLNVNH
jgi:hypothetical protein